ncbi:MAG: CDP-archaeol synthase [Bacteroidota bacterium]
MIIIKKDVFSGLRRPISTTLFGTNKTWRGFVVVPFVNAFFVYWLNLLADFQVSNALILGFTLGFAYMLFELPNSFLKRRLGIESGQQATKHRLLFMLIDKMDSAFGVTLVYFLLGCISLPHALLLFGISSSTHIIISQLLVHLHLKKSF